MGHDRHARSEGKKIAQNESPYELHWWWMAKEGEQCELALLAWKIEWVGGEERRPLVVVMALGSLVLVVADFLPHAPYCLLQASDTAVGFPLLT